jgi:hypothetical protein
VELDQRLQRIEERLEQLAGCLEREQQLRERLALSEEANRQLADQASHVIEQLAWYRKEVRRLEAEARGGS